MYSLLQYACEYGLTHIAALCLARDNGIRYLPLNDDYPVSSVTQEAPLKEVNIFVDCLFRTTHPMIICLLLGFPIPETMDVLSRYFGDLPPRLSHRYTINDKRQCKILFVLEYL